MLVLPRQVDFLLLPGFSMLALCSAIEPLRLANQLLGVAHYAWRHRTADGRPARSSSGMTVPADARADASDPAGPPACLIVLGGFDPWPQTDARLKAWLRGLDRRGALLGAVDTGAFLLAAAEALGGVRPVVHWESEAAFRELFPDVVLADQSHVVEGRRLFCAGGAAVLHLMIDLIARSHGPELAGRLGRRLFVPMAEAPTGTHPAAPLAPQVEVALKTMDDRIEATGSIGEIAAAAGLSRRALERLFRRELGRTPSEVYLARRLDRGQRLLRHTDLPVREVAIACGFVSTPHFCRAYKRRFGLPPGGDRHLDPALVGREIPLVGAPAPAVSPDR